MYDGLLAIPPAPSILLLSPPVLSPPPVQVVQLRHVLRQRVRRHPRQVRLHRRAAGHPAEGDVGVALRRAPTVRVRRHPDPLPAPPIAAMSPHFWPDTLDVCFRRSV